MERKRFSTLLAFALEKLLCKFFTSVRSHLLSFLVWNSKLHFFGKLNSCVLDYKSYFFLCEEEKISKGIYSRLFPAKETKDSKIIISTYTADRFRQCFCERDYFRTFSQETQTLSIQSVLDESIWSSSWAYSLVLYSLTK